MSEIPLFVAGLGGIFQIASGGRAYILNEGHQLALETHNRLWAFGAGAKGQLGNGTQSGSNVPVRVLNLD